MICLFAVCVVQGGILKMYIKSCVEKYLRSVIKNAGYGEGYPYEEHMRNVLIFSQFCCVPKTTLKN